ncbi:hypothetical protein K402DRAFT_309042, partial [Aulographum hederae CBS 113979]
PRPGQTAPDPQPVDVDVPEEEYEWEVDEVVDSRVNRAKKDPATGQRGLLEYKLQYRGFEGWNSVPSWQPYWDTVGCPQLIADFHHGHAKKPGPHESF